MPLAEDQMYQSFLISAQNGEKLSVNIDYLARVCGVEECSDAAR